MSETRSADEAAIHRLFHRINQAWTDADATTFAAGFTEDADYTTFVGTHYRGRAAIVRVHHALWQKFLKGSRLIGTITDISPVTDDVAVVTGYGRVQRRPGRGRKFDKAQTYVAVRDSGGWKFAAFHNCSRRPLLEWIANRSDARLAPQ
jgi:uncharacterized protein (TIGR02246 family)